jgi:phosphonoacetaldehyde hydrolase
LLKHKLYKMLTLARAFRGFSKIRKCIPSKQISTYNVRERYHGPLKTAILDWSGTTADKYVIAPAIVFYNVFKKHNVPISMEEARLPMGLRKDLHIAKILEIPDVRNRWTEIRGTEPTQEDVDMLFGDFVPMQIECLPQYSGLLPETLSVADRLRNEYNLKIGLTTGFTRAMVDVLLEETEKQGFVPDVTVAGDEVESGARPGPFMVYRNLDLFGDDGYPIQSVVKVDDTVGGVGEGLNAGCWSVGIARYSNYMNINSYEEEEQLGEEDIDRRLQHSRDTLENSGAHYVIDTLEQLPLVIDDINSRLANGESPSDATTGKTYYDNNLFESDYK